MKQRFTFLTYSMIVTVLFALLLSGCTFQIPAPVGGSESGSAADGTESAAANPTDAVAQTGITVEKAADEESLEAAIAAPVAAGEGAVSVLPRASIIDTSALGADAARRDGVVMAAPVASGTVVRTQQYGPVTAGVVDDNEKWHDYLDYLARHRHVYASQRDVSERYIIRVWDENAQPVHDALVQVEDRGRVIFKGRTDAGGQLLFMPLALDDGYGQQRQFNSSDELLVVVQKGQSVSEESFLRGQQGDDTWLVTLANPPRAGDTQLDLLFLVDDTGSMGDEIAKLTASMADIADQIDGLPEAPDVHYGLVQYRDRGDSYVVRSNDFTPDLDDFQRALARLRGEGGGDYPEAVNAALHTALWEMGWRTSAQDGDTVRVIILVADAPPHLDYSDERFSYETDMFVAVQGGIKIFPVGASGLDEQGEYIFRQLAQVTGGKFVFLTYEDGSDPSSGPGTETSHDVENYSVDTLDRLIVRLVREELAKLGQPVTVSQVQQPHSTPTAEPRCKGVTWLLKETDGPFSLVGGHSHMDFYRGDTPCEEEYPVLCINPIDLSLPQSLARKVDAAHGWSGGEVRVTAAVSGYDLTAVEVANQMCARAFGNGWRMAEFQDGGDGWNWWAYGEVPGDTRFWIRVNGEPVNPWDFLD